MVAYSFQKRFEPAIVSGLKTQTIRAHRKRHARPGEMLQLYVGMRTKHCRKIIDDPVCFSVENVRLWVSSMIVSGDGFVIVSEPGPYRYVDDEFAIADGFKDAADFTRFWRETHGPGWFEGVLIRWDPIGKGDFTCA